MKLVRRVLLALLVLALPAQMAIAAAPATDWSKVSQRLPSGAFLLGNPAAPVRLIEYLSLTCSHCAHFEDQGIAPLTAKYIAPGRVSYEVRHALRDGLDLAGSMIARCRGPQSFFVLLPKVFAQQTIWFSRAQAWERIEQVEGQSPEQLLPKLARGAGFDSLYGIAPAAMDSCLANDGEQKLLTAQADEAWHHANISGTPAFMINGVLHDDIGEWPQLDAALAAALHIRAAPHPHPLPRKTSRK